MSLFDANLKLYVAGPKGATIRGESIDAWYRQAVNLFDFEWGDDETEGDDWPADGGGSAAAKTFAPIGFTVTKECDLTSPHFFKAYSVTFSRRKEKAVNYFPAAEVILRKVGGASPVIYLILSFTGLLVTDFSMDVGDDGKVKEKVDFRFETTTMEYRQQDPTGKTNPPPEKKGWDFTTNKRL